MPEADAGRVRIGQACNFTSGESESPSGAGRVSVISRAVDVQRRTVEIWCEIARPPSSLRAGAFGDVAFQTGQLRNTVLVPASALQLEEGTRKGTVLVVDGASLAHRREVEVGEMTGDKRVILSGLKAGETVVIEGGYELPDGTKLDTGKGQRP